MSRDELDKTIPVRPPTVNKKIRGKTPNKGKEEDWTTGRKERN